MELPENGAIDIKKKVFRHLPKSEITSDRILRICLRIFRSFDHPVNPEKNPVKPVKQKSLSCKL